LNIAETSESIFTSIFKAIVQAHLNTYLTAYQLIIDYLIAVKDYDYSK